MSDQERVTVPVTGPATCVDLEVFAVVFARQCVPMRSNGVPRSQCGSTKPRSRTKWFDLKVRCSAN